MDGENNGKPYEQVDDLGIPLFLETPIIYLGSVSSFQEIQRPHNPGALVDPASRVPWPN